LISLYYICSLRRKIFFLFSLLFSVDVYGFQSKGMQLTIFQCNIHFFLGQFKEGSLDFMNSLMIKTLI